MTAAQVFDGHNDVAFRLYEGRSGDPVKDFLEGRGGHVDLPKARAGGLVGGFFALWAPSDEKLDLSGMRGASYDVPLPAALDRGRAAAAISTQLALLLNLSERSEGALALCQSTGEIRQAVDRGSVAMLLHLEGADAIDADLDELHRLHAAGLRSLGPVWSRPTIFGHGVPLRFPASPDTGPGLTDAGHRLVATCNELGILIDLAHMNEKGFWDVARLSDAPLVATHSNAHTLSPTPRNLTDRQLAAIRESAGVVGVNFATAYLRPDGQMSPDTALDWVVRHLDHLIDRLGEDGVALGSDYDGAVVPEAIATAAELPVLIARLRSSGYDQSLVTKICFENWMSVLARTID